MRNDDEAEDAFWQDLRRAVDRARQEEAATDRLGQVDAEAVAAAERLLAEGDAAAPTPLDPERWGGRQIDALVADAVRTGTAAGVGSATAVRDRNRRLAPRGLSRVLAFAAALCLSPVFLLAAGATAAVVTVVIRHVRDVEYREGVRLMTSDASPERVMNPAQGLTVARLFWAIKELRSLAAGAEPAMAAAARATLQRMHAELIGDAPFVLRPVPGDLVELWQRAGDSTADLEPRLQALGRFSDLLVYGVSAVNEVPRMAQPEAIQRDNAIYRQQLQDLLEQPIEPAAARPPRAQAKD